MKWDMSKIYNRQWLRIAIVFVLFSTHSKRRNSWSLKEAKFELIKANNFHSPQNQAVKFTSRRNVQDQKVINSKSLDNYVDYGNI